jgi:hypothetical protein
MIFRRYHMLICSLPALPGRVDGGRLPISAERLQKRLRLLDARDAAEIGRFLDVLAWSERFAETSDVEVARRYGERMRSLRHPLVREAAAVVVDARMIVTALRHRRRASGAPAVWIGRWAGHLRRHFEEPDFRLAHVFPRLPELRRLLEAGDAIGFHRGLIGASWDWLRKHADAEDPFSFEAVALYVARWHLMHHWEGMEAERGRAIFESLVTEALGQHADACA